MKNKLTNLMILGLVAVGFGSAATLEAQTRTSRATTRQIQTLLVRIETKTDTFKNEVDRALDQSRINNTNREDSISGYISEFERATDELRQRFDSRQIINNEVTEVLNRAMFIDRFIMANRLTNSAETQWRSLKADLNTLAGYYSVSWNWNQQMPGVNPSQPSYSVTDAQVRTLLTRIENKTDIYKNRLGNALDRSNIDGTNRADSISSYVSEFENSTDRLKQKFDDRQSVGGDVTDVLMRAAYIDQFMNRNRLPNTAVAQWRSLRTDLNTLAAYYRVSMNWNQTLPPFGGTFPGGGFDNRLSGTYRLNVSQSDNVDTVIGRSIGLYTTGQRDNMRRNLERRLGSPEMIAIQQNNRSITLASSLQPQVTFDADGIAKTETNNRGRTITTTATSNRDGLTINYVGDRTNDFYVNFMPAANGQLRVTRRIYLENRNEQITVSSVYDKSSNTAQWPAVNNNNQTGGVNNGNFVISNGTRLTATLRNSITTGTTQANDRFTMDVTSPDQYRGAVIEGRVTEAEKSGRVSGRANVSLDFDTIRLANGQTYRFGGIIDAVTAANGDNITVNNEGTIRDSNRTTTTATRAGIGAVLGAIIGAIAGGGSGAAIGAGVGAGAGAGTVLIQGRDNIDLGQGSTFTITATAPNNLGVNRQ